MDDLAEQINEGMEFLRSLESSPKVLDSVKQGPVVSLMNCVQALIAYRTGYATYKALLCTPSLREVISERVFTLSREETDKAVAEYLPKAREHRNGVMPHKETMALAEHYLDLKEEVSVLKKKLAYLEKMHDV